MSPLLDRRFEESVLNTTVDQVFNWARKSAIWPMTFGPACCSIEMMASGVPRFYIARFGAEVFRPLPHLSDLMIVAGAVTLKMFPVVKRLYDQMLDPKCLSLSRICDRRQRRRPILYGETYQQPDTREEFLVTKKLPINDFQKTSKAAGFQQEN